MNTQALRCPACRRPQLTTAADGSALECGSCGARHAVRGDIVDLLGEVSHMVEHELTGLASENDVDISAGFDGVTVMRRDAVPTTAELMDRSRDDGQNYYQHTTAALFEGLSRCRLDSGMKVLEIGSERTYFKLRVIRDLCAEAWAMNIFFEVTDDTEKIEWPQRVLGDMNDLPFADGYFDLVIASATLHHTTSVATAVGEVARVLRPGGRALIVNEPVEGRLKARGGTTHEEAAAHRDEHIHEVPITMPEWTRALRAAGLTAEHFLPMWYLQKVADLTEERAGAVRFGRLARLVRPIAGRTAGQEALRLTGRTAGQHALGLPLNVVAWKAR